MRSPVPLISIVIIGRNEQKHLARCIESCLAADWSATEIIYCDSQSTDRSVEIARHYPVRVIVHANRRGNPSLGRNIGWRAADGQYIYFIDADMVLAPHFLPEALPVLQADERIACVVGVRKEMRPEKLFISLIDASYHNYVRFGEVPSPSGGGGLFRRKALEDTGGYFERCRASEEPLLGRALRARGYRIILLERVMAHHDLGIYTLSQYLRFRARQAHLFADMLLLNERADEEGYALARKQMLEFFLLLGWLVVVAAVAGYRLPLIGLTSAAASAFLAHSYCHYAGYKRRFAAFVEILVLGKPLHILFQMYYLVRGLLASEHPSLAPDGEILHQYPTADNG